MLFTLFLAASLPLPGRDLPLDKIKLPPGFTISLYADNVPGAARMALGPDGTLFVGTRAEGKVYALARPKPTATGLTSSSRSPPASTCPTAWPSATARCTWPR